ncbi:MAG: metallophosphoesterase [Clostridia bacterium]|nr:metallophosphoesterase [Clostridia bacterium]
MIMNELIGAASSHVRHRLWVISDLQQAFPERATWCMTRAVADFLEMDMPVEAICYLGDSVEGGNIDFLNQMAKMQAEELGKISAPIYYAIGNHDFDYFHCEKRAHPDENVKMRIPLMDYMRSHPQWHFQKRMTDMYYTVDMGDYALCILTDHADPEGRWHTSHGLIRGDEAAYPYSEADYRSISEHIGALGKPVLTFSHYSFPGGNREAPLLGRMLPLPENVRMHFYGHAHVGDAYWAGKDCHRKIAAVDHQPIMQMNVASLENYRGSAIRSAFVEWYDTDEIGVLFRNHTLRIWDDYIVTRKGDGVRAPEDMHPEVQ